MVERPASGVAVFLSLALILGGCRQEGKPGVAPAGVVYAHKADIWLWKSEGVSQLTFGKGLDVIRSSPRFVNAETIAFVSGGRLHRLDLRTRRVTEVLALRGPILAFDWYSTPEIVAYLYQPDGTGNYELHFYEPATKKNRLIKDFQGPSDDRDLDLNDELAVRWAPDGSKVLVVVTHLYKPIKETLYVFGRDGAELAARRLATFALWAPDSRTVFYRSSFTVNLSWWAFDTLTRSMSPLDEIKSGRMHPAVSPDGKYLALVDGRAWIPGTRKEGCTCNLYVYDLSTKKERLLLKGFIAPLWLAPNTLVATAARACRQDECSSIDPMWVTKDAAFEISLEGVAKRTPIQSTLDATSTRPRAPWAAAGRDKP